MTLRNFAEPGSTKRAAEPFEPRNILRRAGAVLASALTIVLLSPTGALAACDGIRYQAGAAPAPSTDGCASAAVIGAVAVGAVAVGTAFSLAFASYLRGALSAADVVAITDGVALKRDELAFDYTAATAQHVVKHPVATYQRQRALGAEPGRPIDVPDALVPAVTAALDGYVRAFAAHEELGIPSMRRLPKAFAAGVETTMAGTTGPATSGIVVARPADVARYAAAINHPLPVAPRPYLDRTMGGRGMWYASHAEKQQLYLHRDTPIGITLPMCDDCYRFFGDAAVNDPAITGPLVTADPAIIRVFNTDGSVDGYWHDGTRAPDPTPQYVSVLRAQNLIP